MSPKQQRRPLPFLLSVSSSIQYGKGTAVYKILSIIIIIVVAKSTSAWDDKLFYLFLSSNIIFDNKLYRTKYVYHIFSHSDAYKLLCICVYTVQPYTVEGEQCY